MTDTDHGKQSAFTLVELLVVVAIIALLVGIALPSFLRARAVTRSMVCQSNLRLHAQAHAAYSNMSNDNKPPLLWKFYGFTFVQWISPNTRMRGAPTGHGLLVANNLLPFKALLCPAFSMRRDTSFDTQAWESELPMSGSSYPYFWRHSDSMNWRKPAEGATYIAAKAAGRTALSMDFNAQEGHRYSGDYEGMAWESHPVLRRVHVCHIDGGVIIVPSDQIILKAPATWTQELDWFDEAHRLCP